MQPDTTTVNLDLNTPPTIYLGSASIDPVEVNGFGLYLNSYTLFSDTDTLQLRKIFGVKTFMPASFIPAEKQELDVTFFLDIDNSTFTLDSAGRNWLTPKVHFEVD